MRIRLFTETMREMINRLSARKWIFCWIPHYCWNINAYVWLEWVHREGKWIECLECLESWPGWMTYTYEAWRDEGF